MRIKLGKEKFEPKKTFPFHLTFMNNENGEIELQSIAWSSSKC